MQQSAAEMSSRPSENASERALGRCGSQGVALARAAWLRSRTRQGRCATGDLCYFGGHARRRPAGCARHQSARRAMDSRVGADLCDCATVAPWSWVERPYACGLMRYANGAGPSRANAQQRRARRAGHMSRLRPTGAGSRERAARHAPAVQPRAASCRTSCAKPCDAHIKLCSDIRRLNGHACRVRRAGAEVSCTA